eukprot:TRINITY_DN1985_c0_g3_i1.p1 TRINITY_DN1985_c0_g3~~TRINITY_DN1985_c0_g3_i1.p1  ORF type:complete len:240 (+),score=11.29 TRINITY_DN1985_c0_g3_i1:292-1011(+)
MQEERKLEIYCCCCSDCSGVRRSLCCCCYSKQEIERERFEASGTQGQFKKTVSIVLSNRKEVATNIGKVCEKRTSKLLIVLKSTVPIGAEEKFDKYLRREGASLCYGLVCVPEFLAEGNAIENLLNPDRVIIGEAFGCTEDDIRTVRSLYSWIDEKKVIRTNAETAQLGKLASNAMLAQRVSSINSLTAICEKTKADIGTLKEIIGSDTRIGSHFINPSPGFGGSCFKKVSLCKIGRTY